MRDVFNIDNSNIHLPRPLIKRKSKCIACKGTGKCQNCHGKGRIPGKFYESSNKSCILCEGTGKCHVCKGKGFVLIRVS